MFQILPLATFDHLVYTDLCFGSKHRGLIRSGIEVNKRVCPGKLDLRIFTDVNSLFCGPCSAIHAFVGVYYVLV